MKITVERKAHLENCTVGMLYLDGEDLKIYSLEDVTRPEKIPGKTAIPAGTYRVIITPSVHFKRLLPLLVSVPQFDGVRIHPGNTDADTEGCILVGKTWDGGDFIGQSRQAFDELFERIKDCEDLWIQVLD